MMSKTVQLRIEIARVLETMRYSRHPKSRYYTGIKIAELRMRLDEAIEEQRLAHGG